MQVRRISSARIPAYGAGRNTDPGLARQSGFTSVQLLLGLCVAAIAAMMADQAAAARESQAVADIGRIQLRAMKFQIDNNGLLPMSLDEMGLGYLTDPWGTDYEYLNFQAGTGDGQKRRLPSEVAVNLKFDVYSRGPDGRTEPLLTCRSSHDDIVRVRDGAFIGQATEYTLVDKHVCP